MAARSIASLTISFGLVAIPVKLYSATQASGAISFNLLHRTCGSRVRQQYFCVKEDIPVSRDEMVKGFEFAKDQYVIFTPDELKALEETATQRVDITEFVPLDGVDPVYYDKAYYLAPDKGGAKPYALLTRALQDSGLCAIGRWAARGKEYIVMLRPVGDGMVMQQLMYADEVRSIDELEIPRAEVREGELKLARQLIEQSGVDRFDPSGFKDDVKARIHAAIEQKVAGQQITVSEEPREGGAQIIDLMEALRASLEKAPRKSAAPAEAGKPAAEGARAPAARKAARKAPKAPAPEPGEEAAPKRAARRK
jgi:DNA end-binding protein Ku